MTINDTNSNRIIMDDPQRLTSSVIPPESVEEKTQQIRETIQQQGDKPHCTVAKQLDLLEQLSQFDFGRYLLQHQRINSYWTNYLLLHPYLGRKTGQNNRNEALTPLEAFLLDRAPATLATQQCFDLFLQENQKLIKDGNKLASIPCGMMGEILYLDFTGINNIELVGIDDDVNALKDAEYLATKQGLGSFVKFVQADAWKLSFQNEFDLISSNGLTLYEPDDDKVTALYKKFYQALKPGGKLITAFLTYPPTLTDQCEWDLTKVDKEDWLQQTILFRDIIDERFQYYRSTHQTQAQLHAAGYHDIQFIYDEAKIFPTVIAYK